MSLHCPGKHEPRKLCLFSHAVHHVSKTTQSCVQNGRQRHQRLEGAMQHLTDIIMVDECRRYSIGVVFLKTQCTRLLKSGWGEMQNQNKCVYEADGST